MAEQLDSRLLVRQLDEFMTWRATGELPRHLELHGLPMDAQVAVQLACRPTTITDPVRAFLSLGDALQAWILRQRNCSDLIGTVVGRDVSAASDVLDALDERWQSQRRRLAALLTAA
jgi:hypothetical protein